MEKKKIAILMGSDSDLPTLKPGIDILKQFGVEYSVRVMSAHRTPKPAAEFASTARDKGYGVIIAAAGVAAHLAGAMAAQSTLPVIGIPVSAGALKGLDALLSTVQMPPGVPVATVAVDGALNAALLAVQILAVYDEDLAGTLDIYKTTMAETVAKKDRAIQSEV